MIKDCKTVYLSLLDVCEPAADTAVRQWAQTADRRHAAKRRLPAAQSRSLLARCLLRDVLNAATEHPGHEWKIKADRWGAPCVSHPRQQAPLAVSIAHSGVHVAVAVTALGAVGIDLEAQKTGRPYDEIAETAFGPQFPPLPGPHAFYRLWCLREAAGKALGRGLSAAPDLRALSRDMPPTGMWRCDVGERTWLLGYLEPVPNVSFALCILPRRRAAARHWSPDSISWHPAGAAPGPSPRPFRKQPPSRPAS